MTESVLDAIVRRCQSDPGAPAITSATSSWTYEMLGQRIAARAEQLRHRLRPGAVIAIVMAAEPESIVYVLAAARAGRIPVLIPSGLPSWEERTALKDSGASYIAARGMFLPLGEEAPPGDRFPHGVMQLTSGSLGPSRPALRSWAGIDDEIGAIVAALDMIRQDTVLVTSAPAHSYAFMGGILAPLSMGAHVVLAPAGAMDVERVQPTVVLGLPAAYAAWTTGYARGSLGSVRHAFSAGAPLPDGLYDTVLRRFGIPIRQDYGSTETGTISLDAGPMPDPLTAGSVLPHLEYRFASAAGREGEIEVRGAAVARGYVVDGRLVPCTDAEGWYRTLDTGAPGPDGRLRLTGRKRPPLQVGSVTLDPRTIEISALSVPGVREAVAVSVGTEVETAVKVVVTGEVQERDLDDWSRRESASLGVPLTAERRDALPRSPAGKLLRKYLL
jgi:long-chain acyl-CoA synthetase